MKNTFLCIALCALLSPCLSASSGQEKTQGVQEAQVIVEKAKIYLEASPFSIVIDTVQQGTVVALFPSGKKDNKWLYISYYSIKRNAQVTGFIKADTVEIFQEEPETQKEKTEEITMEAKDEESSPPVLLDPAKTETEAKVEERSQEIKTPEEIKSTAKDVDKAQTEKSEETEKEQEIESIGQEKKETTEEKQANIVKEEANLIEKQEVQKEESTKTEEAALEEQQPPNKNEEQKKDEEKGIAAEAKEQTAIEGKKVESLSKEKEAGESDSLQGKVESPAEAAHKEEISGNEAKDALQILTKVSIKVRMANVRLMPSLQSAVIQQVPSGVELQTLAKTGDWYRVNLPPDEDELVLSGYVHHSIVNEIYESVQPAMGPEEPEEEPEIIEEAEPKPEPEKEIEPPAKTAKSGFSLWIGGGAGYTLPSESHFEKGMSFGGTLGLQLLKYFAIEVRIPYFQSDIAESFGGLSSGQLRNLTFMLSVQARYPLSDKFVPYLAGGGDYHWNKFNLNDTIKNTWNDLGFTIEEKVDHSFGFHVGAGIDYFLWRNIALNADVRYYTATLKGTWSLADQISRQKISGTIEGMKLNSIQAGISVKFFLGR